MKDGKENYARVLRTTDVPYDLPAIEKIEYSGAFPVSKLKFTDSLLPVEATLYAYSEFHIRDAKASSTPCALFSIELKNPTVRVLESAFVFNMPNHIEGEFSSDGSLSLSKAGKEPTSGNMTIMASGADKVYCQAGDSLPMLWQAFAKYGSFPAGIDNPTADNGMIAAEVTLQPSETKVVTLALSWYFPFRMHYDELIGNNYTNIFDSSSDVAITAFARLPETMAGILEWNKSCLDNSLPDWLQDSLLNSLGTMFKVSIWTKDGRYRQFESFSCSDIEATHIHFARSLPYEFFFPELKKQLFRMYASRQDEDGYINEQYGERGAFGIMDNPHGRVNGDACTIFMLGTYATYKWTGDRNFLDDMWPHIKDAAKWQLKRSEKFGLPDHLVSTYDLSNFQQKDIVSYNAFMHLAGLKVTAEIAKLEDDNEFAEVCLAGFERGKNTLMNNLWTGKFFRCWWNDGKPEENYIHVDTLYGQLWSNILGFGSLIDEDVMIKHLKAEVKYADSPYGLQVILDTDKKRNLMPQSPPKPGEVSGYYRYPHSRISDTVWQAGSIDWTTMMLFLGNNVDKSMSQAEKVINHWRLVLNDQWDYRDLSTVWDGNPYCNSHYARQLLFWAIPMALSGQDYSAVDGKLTLAPKTKAPYSLPFYTPQANGTLTAKADGSLELSVISGVLKLEELVINGKVAGENIAMKAGDVLELN